jgi:hypothetical protein
MTEINIVTPRGMFGGSVADNMMDIAMRVIGVGFGEPGEWASKYGTNYENDVFAMRTQYWGDCTCGAMDTEPGEPERDCEPTCPMVLPNFLFKPTGFSITWYKYIGRSMEYSDHCLPNDFLQQIFATHPKGMTVDQAIRELDLRQEEADRSFREMFDSLGIRHA